MRHLLRIALTCLLALALPLQGYAAGTMINCGSTHDAVTTALAQTAHVHDAVHHHDGHHHADLTGAASGHHADSGDHQKPSSCSACAACCTAIALPSSQVTFGSPVRVEFAAAAIPWTHVVFLTDGPDRPPRFILA
jgi:hypothetical protein